MGEASEDSASESEPSTDDEGSGDTLGSVGYRNGDQCAFTYLGPAEEDLRPEFRAAEDVSVSSSSDEEDD